mgnify:CR=1 FL=1
MYELTVRIIEGMGIGTAGVVVDACAYRNTSPFKAVCHAAGTAEVVNGFHNEVDRPKLILHSSLEND